MTIHIKAVCELEHTVIYETDTPDYRQYHQERQHRAAGHQVQVDLVEIVDPTAAYRSYADLDQVNEFKREMA